MNNDGSAKDRQEMLGGYRRSAEIGATSDRPLPSLRAVLTQARSLIEDPAHWYPGAERAKAEDGARKLLGANCECMVSAPAVVIRNLVPVGTEWEPWDGAVEALRKASGIWGSVADWNDTHSHAEVLAAFDKAIADSPEDPA